MASSSFSFKPVLAAAWGPDATVQFPGKPNGSGGGAGGRWACCVLAALAALPLLLPVGVLAASGVVYVHAFRHSQRLMRTCYWKYDVCNFQAMQRGDHLADDQTAVAMVHELSEHVWMHSHRILQPNRGQCGGGHDPSAVPECSACNFSRQPGQSLGSNEDNERGRNGKAHKVSSGSKESEHSGKDTHDGSGTVAPTPEQGKPWYCTCVHQELDRCGADWDGERLLRTGRNLAFAGLILVLPCVLLGFVLVRWYRRRQPIVMDGSSCRESVPTASASTSLQWALTQPMCATTAAGSASDVFAAAVDEV